LPLLQTYTNKQTYQGTPEQISTCSTRRYVHFQTVTAVFKDAYISYILKIAIIKKSVTKTESKCKYKVIL